MHGPGGAFFIYLEEKNLEPKESAVAATVHIPGPGEPGFVFEEQANLFPGQSIPAKKPVAEEPAIKENIQKKRPAGTDRS